MATCVRVWRRCVSAKIRRLLFTSETRSRACEEVGIRSEHHALPESTTTAELLDLIASLNARDDVDGILTQLPLPRAH